LGVVSWSLMGYISTVDQLTVRRVAKDNAVNGIGVLKSRRRGGAYCGLLSSAA